MLRHMHRQTGCTSTRGAWAVFGFLLLVSAGCGSKPRKIEVPAFDPPTMASESLDRLDQNHDGALSADELKVWPGMRAALSDIDANKDGEANRTELERHFAAYAVGRIGAQSLTCFVMAHGKPVSDAIVEFTPEPIFSEYVGSARAITGYDGSGPVMATGGGFPGVASGMYRVTISKKKGDRELVPKRYNVETELGYEVSTAKGGAPARFNITPR